MHRPSFRPARFSLDSSLSQGVSRCNLQLCCLLATPRVRQSSNTGVPEIALRTARTTTLRSKLSRFSPSPPRSFSSPLVASFSRDVGTSRAWSAPGLLATGRAFHPALAAVASAHSRIAPCRYPNAICAGRKRRSDGQHRMRDRLHGLGRQDEERAQGEDERVARGRGDRVGNGGGRGSGRW